MTTSTRLFPLFALFFAVWAVFLPHWFVPLAAWLFVLLGLIMFAMGLTLTTKDFLNVIRLPKAVFIGVSLQFLLMPLFGWLLAQLFHFSVLLTAGLVLLGSCPGGTASNVICFLSRGNVALSVTLTTLSTLLAFLATPLITWFYVGQSITVPVTSMITSILTIVIGPVLAGMLCNLYLHRYVQRIQPFLPPIAVSVIVLVIAVVTALNADNVMHLTLWVAAAVILHNVLGLASGYWIARWLGCDIQTARTLAIEVGMQNSGLGAALALKYFAPLAALPSALFSVWHNISGALLARYWQR